MKYQKIAKKKKKQLEKNKCLVLLFDKLWILKRDQRSINCFQRWYKVSVYTSSSCCIRQNIQEMETKKKSWTERGRTVRGSWPHPQLYWGGQVDTRTNTHTHTHAHTRTHTVGVTLVQPVCPRPLPWPATSPTEPPCLSLSLSHTHTNTHHSAIPGRAKPNHAVVIETIQQTD